MKIKIITIFITISIICISLSACSINSHATLYPMADANGLWGYINASGKWVIKPQFEKATDFDNNVALVVENPSDGNREFFGIDKKGKKLFKVDGSDSQGFYNGIAVIYDNTGKIKGLLNEKGDYIVSFSDSSISYIGKFTNEGIAVFSSVQENLFGNLDNTKYGYIDKTGKILIEPKYFIANDFCEGKASVCETIGENFGYINKEGEYVIEPNYENATDFNDNVALVRKNKKWFVIDETGKKISNDEFDNVRGAFNEGVAAVKNNGKRGYIDKSGKYIIEPVYDLAFPFYNGFADVKISEDNEKIYSAYIDKNGEILKNSYREFSEIYRPFGKDLGAFYKNENGAIYIDRKGNIIAYDYLKEDNANKSIKNSEYSLYNPIKKVKLKNNITTNDEDFFSFNIASDSDGKKFGANSNEYTLDGVTVKIDDIYDLSPRQFQAYFGGQVNSTLIKITITNNTDKVIEKLNIHNGVYEYKDVKNKKILLNPNESMKAYSILSTRDYIDDYSNKYSNYIFDNNKLVIRLGVVLLSENDVLHSFDFYICNNHVVASSKYDYLLYQNDLCTEFNTIQKFKEWFCCPYGREEPNLMFPKSHLYEKEFFDSDKKKTIFAKLDSYLTKIMNNYYEQEENRMRCDYVKQIQKGYQPEEPIYKKNYVEALEYAKKYLEFAKSEIYARYGLKFDDKEKIDFFDKREWYKPLIEYKDIRNITLSDIEKFNLNLYDDIIKNIKLTVKEDTISEYTSRKLVKVSLNLEKIVLDFFEKNK